MGGDEEREDERDVSDSSGLRSFPGTRSGSGSKSRIINGSPRQ